MLEEGETAILNGPLGSISEVCDSGLEYFGEDLISAATKEVVCDAQSFNSATLHYSLFNNTSCPLYQKLFNIPCTTYLSLDSVPHSRPVHLELHLLVQTSIYNLK